MASEKRPDYLPVASEDRTPAALDSPGTEGSSTSSPRTVVEPQGNDTPENERWVNLVAFFVFGLINNFSYVVFLSAAERIYEDRSGAVLLADATPGLITKLLYPMGLYRLPYSFRIFVIWFVPCAMFLVVAQVNSLPVRLLAIAMTSLVGGIGESTFLSLTATYSRRTVGSWSSGTGAAGVLGAGYYFLLNRVWKLSSVATLRLSAPIPVAIAVFYKLVLREGSRRSAATAEATVPGQLLLSGAQLRDKWPLLRRLFRHYIAPLMLVYYAEYTINQGVLPVIDHVRFFSGESAAAGTGRADAETLRDRHLYVTYQLLYQIGVFVSRSSIGVVRVKRLWLLPLLQFVNLGVLLAVARWMLLKSAWIVAAIVLWEGLLGGAAYVNSFWSVSRDTSDDEREWALGVVAVGDAVGVSLSAVTDTYLECALRVARGEACVN